MPTLEATGARPGDVVTAVTAFRKEPPIWKHGSPVTFFGVDFDESGAEFNATVYQVLPSLYPGIEANRLQVLASTVSEEPTGVVRSIHSGFEGFTGPLTVDNGQIRKLAAAGARLVIRNDSATNKPERIKVSREPWKEKFSESGRRIYIHQDALVSTADTPERAEVLYGSLMRVTAIKTAHHQLSDIEDLGILTNEQVQGVLKSLEGEAKVSLTTMLRQIGYRSTDDERDVFAVLGPEEQIEASCFEDGYYTFATGVEAARLMFADQENMTELKRKVRDWDGPRDLTIISRYLAFIDSEVGTGIDKAQKYFQTKGSRAKFEPAKIASVKTQVRGEVLNNITQIILNSISWDMTNEGQSEAFRNLISTCESRLTRGIFQVKGESLDPNL